MSKVGGLLDRAAQLREQEAVYAAAGQAKAVTKALIDAVARAGEGYRVLVTLVGQPNFRVLEIGYSGGALVVFKGTLPDGAAAWIIQHHTQVNALVSLVQTSSEESAGKIGFLGDVADLPKGAA